MFQDQAREVDMSGPPDRASTQRARYAERKAGTECTRCSEPHTPDSPYCVAHLASEVERARLGMQRIRAERKAKRRCRDCGRPSKKRRCRACHRKKRGVTAIEQGVTQPNVDLLPAPAPVRDRAPDIEARTTRVFEQTGDPSNWGNRSRYHGRARRGPPSRQDADAWDLRAVISEFERGEAGLARFYSAEVQALPRIQRDAHLAEAIGHLELAQRFLDDLVERSRKRLR